MLKRLRIRKLILFLSGICLAGVLYGLIWQITGWGFPCIFNKVTHLQCPGCGISRMILCLLRFDFAGAFRYNQGIFLALPFMAVLFILFCKSYVQKGTLSLPRWGNILLWLLIVWLLIFAVIRNII
jgi:hypothetical protein